MHFSFRACPIWFSIFIYSTLMNCVLYIYILHDFFLIKTRPDKIRIIQSWVTTSLIPLGNTKWRASYVQCRYQWNELVCVIHHYNTQVSLNLTHIAAKWLFSALWWTEFTKMIHCKLFSHFGCLSRLVVVLESLCDANAWHIRGESGVSQQSASKILHQIKTNTHTKK